MKISILLPYKENYTYNHAGAVSIFIDGINKKSKFKNKTLVFGNTTHNNYLAKNYKNINFDKKFISSSSKIYVQNFIKLEKKNKSEIIEIHNRPAYLKYFKKDKFFYKTKFVFYFHNDPLNMTGSSSKSERLYMLDFCDKIIFNSEWKKNRFLTDIDNFYCSSEKLLVINQSTNKIKSFPKKEKIITFVGKLNKSKGFDLFGSAIIKILNRFKNWKGVIIGDEPREKINFHHKNLINLGYKSNKEVLNILAKSSISVSCSRWDEPFGRSSLEASSRGCAVIISNKGGLKESITDGIILNSLDSDDIYKNIKSLILNPSKLKNLQKKSFKNFYLDHNYIAKKIDNYRESLFKNVIKIPNELKIIHVTNFNIRHNGRLFFNTGRRINNGLLINNTVQTFSDRDIVSNERKINDITGIKSLNNRLLNLIPNFKPDLIVFGHADSITNETIKKIKLYYPSIKFCQWFLDKMDDDEWYKNKKRFLNKIDLLDASFCTTHPSALKDLRKNNKVYFIPNPVDKKFDNLKIYDNRDYKYDLFFALSHGVHRGNLKLGKNDDREIFLNKLIKTNNQIKFNIFGMKNIQPIWAEEFKVQLNQSKMALNLSQGKPLKFYSSDRIAQLIGNGILTFIDKKTHLNKLFNDDEVIFYKNIKDLANKINKFKDNDKLRSQIAKNGMIKYHKHMNNILVASYMIDKTFKKNIKFRYFWENK
jgi:glycosyltransferase involved in cell wall biosynthesis